ncbi:hypothetical protein [Streptomyces dysideae]|uniref:hypothetical protein n=1 Tax=Streptomyces dysideae TaxID=909626 RepID=UPI0018FEDA63|nr:hypothetical protein [Streptomyces dysideae]
MSTGRDGPTRASAWNHRGSHTVNYNATHIGVCFIGTSIRSLYYKAPELCGRALNATDHSGLPGAPTACPGNDLRNSVLGGMDGESIPIVVTPGIGSGGRSNISSVVSQQGAVDLLGHTPRLAEDGVFGALTLAGVILPAVLRPPAAAVQPILVAAGGATCGVRPTGSLASRDRPKQLHPKPEGRPSWMNWCCAHSSS